jgi:NAD(P)-dependent dehydrogenase (short-subunit alcohol dehydrogenase family)
MSEPNTESYAASEGGIVALTHALAVSLGPDIRANCVSPGWIETKDYSALRRRTMRNIPPAASASRKTSPRSSPGCSTASAPGLSPAPIWSSTAA